MSCLKMTLINPGRMETLVHIAKNSSLFDSEGFSSNTIYFFIIIILHDSDED